jgi:hypothetical protein
MRAVKLSLGAAAALAASSLAGPPRLDAQEQVTLRDSATARRLGVLAQRRASQWARSKPEILCGPAPLTERPGVAAEFARPRVVPLESAFLDGATTKRRLAAKHGRSAR